MFLRILFVKIKRFRSISRFQNISFSMTPFAAFVKSLLINPGCRFLGPPVDFLSLIPPVLSGPLACPVITPIIPLLPPSGLPGPKLLKNPLTSLWLPSHHIYSPLCRRLSWNRLIFGDVEHLDLTYDLKKLKLLLVQSLWGSWVRSVSYVYLSFSSFSSFHDSCSLLLPGMS